MFIGSTVRCVRHTHETLMVSAMQSNIDSRLGRPTWTSHLAPQLQSLYVAAFAPPRPPAARQRGPAAAREASAEPPSAERPLLEAPAEDGAPMHDGEQEQMVPGEFKGQGSLFHGAVATGSRVRPLS